MKNRKNFLLILSLLTLSVAAIADPGAPPEKGKAIFSSRCASCHNVNKELTGPALAGLEQRRSMDWIISFVHSSQTMVRNGDKDALAVFEKFNKIAMPDHADLTDDDIRSVVAFIKTESKAVADEKAPFAKPSQRRKHYTPLSLTDDAGFFVALLACIGVLIGVLLFAVKVDKLNKNYF